MSLLCSYGIVWPIIFLGYFMHIRFTTLILCLLLSTAYPRDKALRPLIQLSPFKSGTHLLNKCIRLINQTVDNDPTQCLRRTHQHVHQFYITNSAEHKYLYQLHKAIANNYKVILIVRDPRDILISTLFYIEKKQFYKDWGKAPVLSLPPQYASEFESMWINFSDEERLSLIINGAAPHPLSAFKVDVKATTFLFYIRNTFKSKNLLITRFENLVGSKGGGSDSLQEKEIQKIARFINVPLSEKQIGSVANELFGASHTFRKGQIGSWKQHLTPELIKQFKYIYQKDLEILGYEKNSNWGLE